MERHTLDDLEHYIPSGANVIVEPITDGIILHTVRPDIRRAYIEVTTRCNLNCVMCVRRVWRDIPGEMSWETYQAVIQGLRPCADEGSLKRIIFGGFGEPLIHPHILDMLATAQSLNVGITLTTNATLLDKTMAKSLIEARVDTIIVSLDTMHMEAFEDTMPSMSWQTVLENIHSLQDLRNSNHLMVPRLGFEFVATRYNLADLPKVIELAKEMGAAFILVTNLLPYTEEMVSHVLYDCKEPLPVPTGWAVASGDYLVWGTVKIPRMKWGAARRCQFIDDRAVVIGWDGGVSPCYALMHSYPYYIYGRRKNVERFVLGNVRHQALADIWMSRDYVLFRSKVRGFRFPSCVDCGMACTFTQDNADCWGNAPSCADCLWAQDIIRCP